MTEQVKPVSKHDLSRGPIRCVITLDGPWPSSRFDALAKLAMAIERCAATLAEIDGPQQ